jgi:hypothetical protein
MAHEITNINSQWGAAPNAIEAAKVFAEDHLNFLTHTWDATPVYLIDKNTMDDKVYPRKRRRMLGQSCAREAIKAFDFSPDIDNSLEDDQAQMDRLFKALQECVTEATDDFFIALGVFWAGPTNPLPVAGLRFPCIFICPDRIEKPDAKRLPTTPTGRVKKPDTGFRILFAQVLFHELGHAYMFSDQQVVKKSGDEFWTRVIEESLANTLSWGRFNPGERSLVNQMISSQPVEYRGCTFWQEFSNPEVREMARAWSDYKPHPHPPLMEVLFARTAAFRNRLTRYTADSEMEYFAQIYLDKEHPEKFWKVVAHRILIEVLR